MVKIYQFVQASQWMHCHEQHYSGMFV